MFKEKRIYVMSYFIKYLCYYRFRKFFTFTLNPFFDSLIPITNGLDVSGTSIVSQSPVHLLEP